MDGMTRWTDKQVRQDRHRLGGQVPLQINWVLLYRLVISVIFAFTESKFPLIWMKTVLWSNIQNQTYKHVNSIPLIHWFEKYQWKDAGVVSETSGFEKDLFSN